MMTFGLLLLAVILVVLALRRPPGPPPSPDLAEVPVGPGRLEALLRLPEPARARAWALLCSVQDALATPGDARASFVLREVRDTYLPDTVDAFLRVTSAGRAQLERQRQSPEALLLEQLTLMEGGVREALQHDHVAADRLLSQGRFLREKFGSQELRVEER